MRRPDNALSVLVIFGGLKMKCTSKHLNVILTLAFFGVMLSGIPAQGEKPVPGKTYDKTNYQEIEEYCNPPLRDYLQSGEFIIKVGELNFSATPNAAYVQASVANEGKYDVDENGILIDKKQGQPAEHVYGDPFPTIDTKDSKAAYHLAANFFYGRYRAGSNFVVSQMETVGKSGLERTINAESFFLYFQNRKDKVQNKDNFLECKLTNTLFPYDLRGNSNMTLTYNDARDDTTIIYTPTMRRVRRTSSADRSNPFAGTDSCLDDSSAYAGKIAQMTWKFLGDKEILVPFATSDRLKISAKTNRGYKKSFTTNKAGYMVPGWQAALYAPVNPVYVVRPVWLLEMMAVDTNYNYGRQLLYVDKDTYIGYYKEVYDRQGAYWKCLSVFWSFQLADDGTDFRLVEFYIIVDWKTHHATCIYNIDCKERPEAGTFLMPWNVLNSSRFTQEALVQQSK
jgi:hypothetical protein